MKQRSIRPGQIALLLAISLVHVAAWFAYYGDLPAGQYPTQAARAYLSAAQAAADSQTGTENPAAGDSLYTYVLSIFARFSDAEGGLVAAARSLNALAFLWITGVCASAACRYWQSNRAVWIAGLLVGLNPVLVFWAGEITPALLAAACMSSAVALLLPWFKETKISSSLIIAVFLTLAASLQTVLLPFALVWPIFAWLYPTQKKMPHLGVSGLPPVVLFALIILTNLSLQTSWQWELGPFSREAYSAYLALTNQEASQGKSYALYRELHFILLFNPIHWGALFILAAFAFYARFKENPWSPSVLVAIAILVLFALSFALNDGGSQSRVSLIPLVAIFAAGAYQLPRIWHRSNNSRRLKFIWAGLLLAVLSYAPQLITGPAKQWENDYAHLARANLAMDQNQRATNWAEKALELDPGRRDMQAVLVTAQFNNWAMGSQPKTLPIETAREYLAATKPVRERSTLRSIRAIYQYKLRNAESALATWQADKESCPLALLCLYWTGTVQPTNFGKLDVYSERPYYHLLVEALSVDRNALGYTDLEKQIDNLLALAY